MAGKVADIRAAITTDQLAEQVADLWREWDHAREKWKQDKRELRNYVFATDTTTTTNAKLPWKNKTTLPKICQIRDNLHANYKAALFPNDDWLIWEPTDRTAAEREKARAVKAYMQHKLKLFNFVDVIDQLIYDYIYYGHVICDCDYTIEYYVDQIGETQVAKQGPRALRRSPLDVVINPLAPRLEDTPEITRYVMSIGELEKEIRENPKAGYLEEALSLLKRNREAVASYRDSDIDKAYGLQFDGFGSFSQYMKSGWVEILEFKGDLYDHFNQTYYAGQVITVVDRQIILRNEPMDTWSGKKTSVSTQWRKRPDNLYGMGPLDNLVGMQYRIDHLENIKADLFDLVAHPPLKIKGQVEEFEWEPFAEIYLGEDGDVVPLQVDTTALTADTQIAILEQKMEEFAGAPRQAVGIRTPGEKTAFEVNILEQNSSKMFQEKVVHFEMHVLEPLLNNMLELARQQLDTVDLVSTMDDDTGAMDFMEVSAQDIRSRGKLRPMGARHFAARAQMVQNYQGFRNIFGADPAVMNHVSGKREAEMFEELLGFSKYTLVRDNVRLQEQAESARLTQEYQRMIQEEAMTPADSDEAAVPPQAPVPPEGQ